MEILVTYAYWDRSHNWGMGNISKNVNSHPTSILDVRNIEKEIRAEMEASKVIVLNIIPFAEGNQTNADRIRSMTDEELAKLMLFFAPTTLERAMYTGISGKYTETAEETIQNNLDWLKSPAESEE